MLSRLCAKHREIVIDMSDKAHCLEAPQEKHHVNQCKKPTINYICVQRSTRGKYRVLGERIAASKLVVEGVEAASRGHIYYSPDPISAHVPSLTIIYLTLTSL